MKTIWAVMVLIGLSLLAIDLVMLLVTLCCYDVVSVVSDVPFLTVMVSGWVLVIFGLGMQETTADD